MFFVLHKNEISNEGWIATNKERNNWIQVSKENYKVICNRYNLQINKIYLSYLDFKDLYDLECYYNYDFVPCSQNRIPELEKKDLEFPKWHTKQPNQEDLSLPPNHQIKYLGAPQLGCVSLLQNPTPFPMCRELQQSFHIRYHKPLQSNPLFPIGLTNSNNIQKFQQQLTVDNITKQIISQQLTKLRQLSLPYLRV
jgi:hypothetical protein